VVSFGLVLSSLECGRSRVFGSLLGLFHLGLRDFFGEGIGEGKVDVSF